MKSFITTTPESPWQKALPKTGARQGDNPLRISGKPAQTILGFGGCFNELGARELFRLPVEQRSKILEDLFSDEGCAFNFCRIPIGASDYALKWYSHNDTDGDLAMRHFSIARDREFLLPYIKAAQAVRPGIQFFASPWSPPSWMKEHDRYNGSTLRDEPEAYAAYADYLLKFVRSYREEGVEISQLHIQNEPNSDQKFPSCLWTGSKMRGFIRDYLGPKFEAAGERCEIWAGTIERGALVGWEMDLMEPNSYQRWLHTIMADPKARQYVKGVGYQWNGKGALAQTRANWPSLPVIQTENECGDGKNTWAYAFYVFDLMWHYFNNGCSAYAYWNMILAPGGESTWGWRQNTMISVDGAKGEIVRNPEFYVMNHLASAVRPGAKFLPISGDQAAMSMLFVNPDGSRVLALANPLNEPAAMDVEIDGLPDHLVFAPRTVNTLVF